MREEVALQRSRQENHWTMTTLTLEENWPAVALRGWDDQVVGDDCGDGAAPAAACRADAVTLGIFQSREEEAGNWNSWAEEEEKEEEQMGDI